MFDVLFSDKAFTKPSCNPTKSASSIVWLIMLEVLTVIAVIVALIILASLVHYVHLKIRAFRQRRTRYGKRVDAGKTGEYDQPSEVVSLFKRMFFLLP